MVAVPEMPPTYLSAVLSTPSECVMDRIGDLTAVTLAHDSKGSMPGWLPECVVVTKCDSGQEWRFECGRWLDMKRDDGATQRQFAASSPASQVRALLEHAYFFGLDCRTSVHCHAFVLACRKACATAFLQQHHITCMYVQAAAGTASAPVQYTIDVTTADDRGAGTDADVHVLLEGPAGSTGRVALRHAAPGVEEHSNPFERRQVDTFLESAVDVGTVTGLTVGHNNKGPLLCVCCN